ncbi:hypothetical protein [Acinetobacter sp. ANC5681]|uniref:hypothetical protein n=1 Tax=Acinetobacter sp. ANC5681 TaxID=2929504 RepID=UPI00201A872C|nr:hypothetical protein [Acinetobacter sp. ANC5681]MCL5767331.1 hypothetical protein [Acinetobacter sp. ANC5681]
MKTLNINAYDGFTTEIEAIQFWQFEYGYSANVAVKCGDSGVVLLCLSGDENEARAEWPQDMIWSEEDKEFQLYIESEFTAAEFLHILESEDKIIENNMYYLEQYGEKMN